MPFRVELTERAVRDLSAIHAFILARHVGRAAAWFDGLERRIADLAALPERGTAVPEQPALRQVLYGRRPHVYRVIYRVDAAEQAVLVIHIRHGARARAPL
ncbi:MAG: type II toxin-antitoxin system RelE/ParE family toxin [Acetobacteraceae bacterium]|nr:type II toxin-antitoxin system RelE/ParE family toxin [Acetobacteraceae bacterium]